MTHTRAKKRPSIYKDYKEAIEGEGWAIVDYTDMISKAKTKKERDTLIHIRDEEKEHLKELMDLLKCRVEKNGT